MSGYFAQLSKSVHLQSADTLVSFNAISLFTNVPVDEALQVIIHNDDSLAEWSVLKVEPFMGLLQVYLRTIYFHVDDKFSQQKDDMATRSVLLPIVNGGLGLLGRFVA
jgi:hypothetical protein